MDGKYAHAAFSAAAKTNSLEKVEQDLKTLQEVVAGAPKLREFLERPTVTR